MGEGKGDGSVLISPVQTGMERKAAGKRGWREKKGGRRNLVEDEEGRRRGKDPSVGGETKGTHCIERRKQPQQGGGERVKVRQNREER